MMQNQNNSTREVVINALARQCAKRPPMPQDLVDANLDSRDRQLAWAIHRITLQRWLTLEHLLSRALNKPLFRFNPVVQAALLSGAAQLLFMDRIPSHAAVSESVKVVREQLGKSATKLTNAVLRKIAGLVDEEVDETPWQPSRTALPLEQGQVKLKRLALPALEEVDDYWSVATSHPKLLVANWRKEFGDDVAFELLKHSLKAPPIFLHTPDGVLRWTQGYSDLVDYLSSHENCWVQDPTHAHPIAATAEFKPKRIVDYCAGRGTKTRQLLATHPDAQIIATDINDQRLEQLQEQFEDEDRVEVVPIAEAGRFGVADLLLLDVPCSNTGVLARRLEARYRYTRKNISGLGDLQRQIINKALPLLAEKAVVLYATCSIEPSENLEQVQMIAKKVDGQILGHKLTLPGGSDDSYHDGGFYGLIQKG